MDPPVDEVGLDLALAFASADEKIPEVEMKRLEESRGDGAFVASTRNPSPPRPSSNTGMTTVPAAEPVATEGNPRRQRALLTHMRLNSSGSNDSFGSDLSREDEDILSVGVHREESLRPPSCEKTKPRLGLAERLKTSLGLASLQRQARRKRRKVRRGTHASDGSVGRVANASAGVGRENCVKKTKTKVRRIVKHELFAPCARTCVVLSVIVILGVFAVSFIGWSSSKKIIRDGKCVCVCVCVV